MENKEEKVAIIESDTIISIEMSGYFLQRLQGHLFNKVSKLTPEERLPILERIRKGETALTPEEDELHVFTAILSSADVAAKAQNKAVYKTLDELKELYNKSTES